MPPFLAFCPWPTLFFFFWLIALSLLELMMKIKLASNLEIYPRVSGSEASTTMASLSSAFWGSPILALEASWRETEMCATWDICEAALIHSRHLVQSWLTQCECEKSPQYSVLPGARVWSPTSCICRAGAHVLILDLWIACRLLASSCVILWVKCERCVWAMWRFPTGMKLPLM